MSKMSQMHLEMQEQIAQQEQFQTEDFNKQEPKMMSEREMIAQHKKEVKEQKEEIKTNKLFVFKMVVEEIKLLTEKYGFSYRITGGGANYYFNSKTDIANKMFEKGKMAAFTAREKESKGKKYMIIEQVLFTF